MLSLNTLKRLLGLPPEPTDLGVASFEDAQRLLPDVFIPSLRAAFMQLLAESLLPQLAGLQVLLDDLEQAASRPQPERAIVRWLADVTGGRATIRSSWGDVVAQHGQAEPAAQEGAPMSQLLNYDGRPVGHLELEAAPHWQPLLPLVVAQARQARLQSAAAGAARRRVGERQFEALLAGDISGQPESKSCALAALRFDQPMPRATRAREAFVNRLDVLCSVGEGYFHGRDLRCLTTVRGDKALWLWQTRDPEREARGLHTALLRATEAPLRLGVSGSQPGYASVGTALRQALQALDEVRVSRELTLFQRIDPLQTVLNSSLLNTLSEQVHSRLRAEDAEGRLEDTLRQYLDHRGSLADLAQSMNLHVNTLRYRLRRAEEILGGELSEPAFVTRLYLAFRISVLATSHLEDQ